MRPEIGLNYRSVNNILLIRLSKLIFASLNWSCSIFFVSLKIKCFCGFYFSIENKLRMNCLKFPADRHLIPGFEFISSTDFSFYKILFFNDFIVVLFQLSFSAKDWMKDKNICCFQSSIQSMRRQTKIEKRNESLL